MSLDIGLLGGTFNPVHRGHVELGIRVGNTFHLDRILYVLSARPPHKSLEELAPVRDRLEMLQVALAPYPRLEACDMEMHRHGRSYSIDTVESLKRRFPRNRFFFISGSEGFLQIPTWKEWRRLLQALVFIVVLREPAHLDELRCLLRPEKVPIRLYPLRFDQPPGVNILAYDSETLPFSSTRIRRRRSGGGEAPDMLDPHVESIMEEKGLYGE
ncbi:MAG: nicotinate (nicotinamide) nucleotide adenylyltransferase [Acidobacteriota bacterium]|jgi:nicotinate-nucleotide adenylyltransferase|nr:nicotinate (nicotinamide) nucleotide adenylyltransferase [Acidobacteriota bacterium]